MFFLKVSRIFCNFAAINVNASFFSMTIFQQMLLCAGGLGLASLLGSTAGLLVRKIPHHWNDIFLGFCAGMMLTASLVCLIVPAVEMAGPTGCWQPLIGVALGVLLIAVLDKVTPHLHHITGVDNCDDHEESHCQLNKSINRVLLFVIAIAIHKFPEGLAAGVVFDGSDIGNAYTVALTIALQNIPEGMVVVTPLLMIGVSYPKVIAVSLAVAMMEIVGVLIGFFIGDFSAALLPTVTAIAGGAMLYVISDEMIPETHSHGYEKYATYALVAGVMCMLYINMLF